MEDFVANLAKGTAPDNTISITVELNVIYYVVRPKTKIKTWSIKIPPKETSSEPVQTD